MKKSHLDKLDDYKKLEVLKSHEKIASKMEESQSVEELQELEAGIGMTIDELRDEIYYLNKNIS